MSLDGATVVVTGASSGLGVAFAEAFAAEGANLVLSARRLDKLKATRARIGDRAIAVQADVSLPEDCERTAAAAMDTFGRVDVLINNAGVGRAEPSTREQPDDFRAVVDINLHGSYWMAQACARKMQPGSSIINIGSILGQTTMDLPQAAYAASKAAIIGLTRDLAMQWTGRKGIRVNALAPGYFHAEMTQDLQPEYVERICARTPAGRFGEGHELAAAAVFLASPAASYISGIVLPVDGGLLTS